MAQGLSITPWPRASGSARGETLGQPGGALGSSADDSLAHPQPPGAPADTSELLSALCGHLIAEFSKSPLSPRSQAIVMITQRPLIRFHKCPGEKVVLLS